MILVDGAPSGSIPVTDSSVLRGDGVFEALRTFDGEPFQLAAHLDRLGASADPMGLQPPDRATLEAWVRRVAMPEGPGLVRIVLTRGDDTSGSRTIVLSQPVPPVPDPFTLLPITAPWHPAGRPWRLAGVKTLSYAPNLDAHRQAVSAGCSDALLLSDDGIVLEGPTFSVGWLRNGVFETPSLDLGILASITRRETLELADELGVETATGRFPIGRLTDATDLVAMSTVKHVTPIGRCGDVVSESTGFDRRLRAAFLEMVDAHVSG